ncbi:hypothetical protein C8A00DRAFT_36761 [Chaetomidium leptoderma]|uniref:C2H2-type domain-containing protein n=1 Tax=Chaetomidium leptoderma TaxID=669021 RepID=A0AAN6VGW7_9PEZI|nr:hypothetical protein C8A00DRAFT_36761 [Chaetomidium leptoderma]
MADLGTANQDRNVARRLNFRTPGRPVATQQDNNDNEVTFMGRDEFSHFFATINLRRFTKTTTPGFQQGLYGGSAEDPRLAKLQCPNQKFGCKYEVAAVLFLDMHLKTCPFTSPEYLATLLFACEEPDCGKSFATKDSLRDHMYSIHNFKPRTYSEPDCTSTEVFTTRRDLLHHVAKHHSGWTPQACPVPDCDTKLVYKLRESFKRHLKRKHADLGVEELAKYMPDKRRPRGPRATSSRRYIPVGEHIASQNSPPRAAREAGNNSAENPYVITSGSEEE